MMVQKMLYRDVIELETKEGMSFIDITQQLRSIVENCNIKEGVCQVFLPATTAGLYLNEKDRMLLEDFKKHLSEHVDEKKMYHHSGNAFSHLRALMLRNDLTLPVSNGKLILGTWQSIMLWEFDNESRKRSVIVTVIGE